MKKDTLISVWWRGENYTALVHAPVDRSGKVRLSVYAQIRAVEEANGIKIDQSDGVVLGGL
jgi:hypothetical protein